MYIYIKSGALSRLTPSKSRGSLSKQWRQFPKGFRWLAEHPCQCKMYSKMVLCLNQMYECLLGHAHKCME